MDRKNRIFFAALTIFTYSERLVTFSAELVEPHADATVTTNCGKVSGVWLPEESGFSFRGIPYASPPTVMLRWRPPVGTRKENNNCWSGTLSAKTFGSPCVQRDVHNVSKVIGSEDCLYLNVLTPTLNDTAKLPVMFWIHGGYLTSGNGNEYEVGYAPTVALAKQLNVVFVSINYRLNAFGFMALEWLKARSPTNTSGNYGFMDMVEALRWVQENIKMFGGDQSHVTIFGQSSGGTSVMALLASPLSKGLFHKAWMISGSSVMNKTAPETFKDNEIFISNSRCKDVSCLYNLSSADVIACTPWDVYPYWSMDDHLGLPVKNQLDGALAIVDGFFLREAPFEAWVHGNGIDVPVMIGTTAQETDQRPLPHKVVNWTWATSDYRDHVIKKLGTFNDLITTTALHLYPENVSTPEFQLTSMSSDIRVNCGMNYLASILAASIKSPVYRYVATYYSTDKPAYPFGNPFPVRYAYHGIDIFGFFKTMNYPLGQRPGLRDTVWEDRVQLEVMAFVKTGKPETVEWQRYPAITAELDTVTRAYRGYHATQCEFWLKNGFFSYSWLN